MADEMLTDRVGTLPDPGEERVSARAAELKREHRTDDPEAQAEAMLAESDARTNADPAVRDLDDDRLERRTSDEATPPADV
jgi:hypothetical protein